MPVEVSERAFEDAIEASLLQNDGRLIGEERVSYLDPTPGGYRKRTSGDYDRAPVSHPRGHAGLRAADAAPGMGAACPASRGHRREGTVSQAAGRRDCPAGRPGRAAPRHPGHGLPVPIGLLPPVQRPERRDGAAAPGQTSSRWSVSSITASGTTKAWTWPSSSTASPFSRRS